MIARITFDGIVKAGKKKSSLSDFVDIHVVNLTEAKAMFLNWISSGQGIRGNSGIFHPLRTDGDVKVKKVEEHVA